MPDPPHAAAAPSEDSSLHFYYASTAPADNNNNNNNEDETLARDMQLALDLQMAQDLQDAEQRRSTGRGHRNDDLHLMEHGFFHSQQPQDDMLFVTCTLNGRPNVHLLVDSGASVSAMSLSILSQLGFMDLLNVNVSGACGGVGSARIVGVVENLVCLIGHVEFRLYFLVIDSELPSVVLGLDQMRRFKCVIDMESDCLCFGGKDGVKVPFLSSREARKAKRDYERMIRANHHHGNAAGAGNDHGTHRRHTNGTGAMSSSSLSGWIPSLFGRHRPASG